MTPSKYLRKQWRRANGGVPLTPMQEKLAMAKRNKRCAVFELEQAKAHRAARKALVDG